MKQADWSESPPLMIPKARQRNLAAICSIGAKTPGVTARIAKIAAALKIGNFERPCNKHAAEALAMAKTKTMQARAET